MAGAHPPDPASFGAIAAAFTRARARAMALPGFPGAPPETLADAYRCQEAALALWPERPVGWKVGRVQAELQARLGAERLAGPIFPADLWSALPPPAVHDFPVFIGGFAAVEAEYVARLAADAPTDRHHWTAEQAADLVAELRIGVETAGSPLATINALGPTVVVSDFGNNAGLILGGGVTDWRRRLPDLHCRTRIDGREVGAAPASTLPGGPLAGLAFLLGHCAARGRPLKAGDLVSTGAVTGVHAITAGQSAEVDFGPDGVIACRAVPAHPRPWLAAWEGGGQ